MKFMHKAAKKWPKAAFGPRDRDTEANGPSKLANKSGDKATAKSNTKLPQN